MPRRMFHWIVLGFTTLWFGVLVPVHNRGEIALPGGDECGRHQAAASAAAPSCHAARPDSNVIRPAGHCPDPDPAPRRGGSCAVCFFIAGLDAPPPVTVVQTRLGLLGACDAAAPSAAPTGGTFLPYHSRAPPAA